MPSDVVGDYWAVTMSGCHHELSWKQVEHTPAIGEVVWCHWCHAERPVTSVVGAWRVKCKNCRYARKFGRARMTAERAAAKHARARPGHTVTWWQTGRDSDARSCSLAEQGQQQLGGEPPW